MSEIVDKLIKQWAERRAPDAVQEQALEDRIVAEVRRMHRLRLSAVPARAFPSLLASRLTWAVLGAVVALGAGAIFIHVRTPGIPPPNGSELAGMSQAGARTVQRLFEETNRLFDDQLRWVTQSDGGNLELGLAVAGERAAAGRQPVAVRVTIVSRPSNRDAWKRVWQADVLTWTEEAVELKPDLASGNKLALWVFPVGNGNMALDSRFDMKMPLQISSQASAIVREGQPLKTLTVREGEAEYCVFQTVKRLFG